MPNLIVDIGSIPACNPPSLIECLIYLLSRHVHPVKSTGSHLVAADQSIRVRRLLLTVPVDGDIHGILFNHADVRIGYIETLLRRLVSCRG